MREGPFKNPTQFCQPSPVVRVSPPGDIVLLAPLDVVGLPKKEEGGRGDMLAVV